MPRAAHAQGQREWRIQAIGVAAPDPYAGVGGSVLVRSHSGVGAAVTATLGARAHRPTGRGEALLSFSLDPLRQRGIAPYVAGGVAVIGDRAGAQEYLVAAVGLALNPGARRGWFVEAGVGGGVRLCMGMAFRRFPR